MSKEDALADAAVAEIRSGMTVGLGTGRAATRAIEALARRATAERLDLLCVATSKASDELGRRLGLRVEPMEGVARVDLLFDGADEVDPELRMIKGRGGAMTREKIVAHAAGRCVYLAQSSKMVDRLGATAPLPIEVMRFGLAACTENLKAIGLSGPIRSASGGAGGEAYQTDNGNPVIDAALPDGVELAHLCAALDAIPGVVGHGLFLTEASVVLVEDEQGRVTRHER